MKANRKFMEFKQEKNAYAQLVSGLIAFFLIIGIGVMIFYKVNDSYTISDPAGAQAKNNTSDMFNTVINLMPIIGLVLIAGIIISIISGGFGKTRGGGL